MDATSEGEDGHWSVSEEVLEYLRISLSDLHDEEMIGHGSSSVVYKAKWLGCEVAVKDVLLDRGIGGSVKCFPKELEILMRLPHPHVVQLLGFRIKEEERRVSIVMERMETSLRSVIARRLSEPWRRLPFHVHEAIDIVKKFALGMKFLHSREIVHGGLSTAIILMNVHGDRDFEVKIAGFAFSDYASSPTLSTFPGPNPPEFVDHSPIRVTKAVDVYSFGMICYAAMTGCEVGLPPWNGYVSRDEIVQAVVSGLRPELIPPDIDHDLMDLILKCWKAEPEQRPSFSAICDTLDAIRDAQGFQKQLTSSEKVEPQRWTTYKDNNDNTCLEVAAIVESLPNHLSIDPVDVEWRRPIGKGGYSEVFEVNWLECLFAVKGFKSLSADLKREVEILTKLQHPHIAWMIGLSIDSNGGWIMMECMQTDVEKLIHSRASKPPFSHSEALELCFKIALGLHFLHSKNVVHRGIKPANVLVHDYLFRSLKFYERFDVKITDFGMSHRIGNSNVATVITGTGMYRAPEILKAKRDAPLTEDQLKKTGIYSFGMTCYEIVTGNALTISKVDVIAKRWPKLPHGLDADYRELIGKCGDDDPEARPDFSNICHVLAGDPESGTRVVQRSRVGKIVEFWRRRSLLLSANAWEGKQLIAVRWTRNRSFLMCEQELDYRLMMLHSETIRVPQGRS